MIFFTVLVFYAYDYVDGLSYFRSVQNWPVTEGIVARNTLAPVIPREKVDPLEKTFAAPTEEKGVEYTYKVDGKDYSSTRLVAVQPQKFLQSMKMFYDMPDEKALGIKYPVGSPVEVHYNPANPAEACLDVSSGWKSRYVAICFSAPYDHSSDNWFLTSEPVYLPVGIRCRCQSRSNLALSHN